MRLRVHSNSEEIKFMRAMAYIIEVNKEKKKKERMCFKARLMDQSKRHGPLLFKICHKNHGIDVDT